MNIPKLFDQIKENLEKNGLVANYTLASTEDKKLRGAETINIRKEDPLIGPFTISISSLARGTQEIDRIYNRLKDENGKKEAIKELGKILSDKAQEEFYTRYVDHTTPYFLLNSDPSIYTISFEECIISLNEYEECINLSIGFKDSCERFISKEEFQKSGQGDQVMREIAIGRTWDMPYEEIDGVRIYSDYTVCALVNTVIDIDNQALPHSCILLSDDFLAVGPIKDSEKLKKACEGKEHLMLECMKGERGIILRKEETEKNKPEQEIEEEEEEEL